MSMVKLLYSDSFDTSVDVGMRIVEDPAVVTKQASTIFGCDYDDLKPDKDHVGIHLVALGAGERYGCFFEGATVRTLDGLVPIEQVKVGDKVLTHKNRYRKVTETFTDLYDGVGVTLHVRGLPEPIESTANHPFLCVRGEKFGGVRRWNVRNEGDEAFRAAIDKLVDEAEWLAADAIKPGDFVVIPCADDIESEHEKCLPAYADPYTTGLYVAEGCLSKEYRQLSSKGRYKNIVFTMSTNDAASIEYLNAWHVKLGHEPVTPQPSYTSEKGVRITFGNTEYACWLDEHFGHLADTKRIHPVVFAQSREWKLKFLAGYFDGDGCTAKGDDRYTGTLTASTVSKALALDVQRLCASLAIPVNVCKGYNRQRNGCFGRGDLPIYFLTIGSLVSNQILQHCLRLRTHEHAPTDGRRGGSSTFTSGRYILLSVKKTEQNEVAARAKFNLEVEEDSSYVVDIQGHNSNRNADYMPKSACIRYHDTFVKHGHVYRHHRNKDPNKALGTIKMSVYNDDMDRIELFIHAHKEKARDELERLHKESEIPFSMALRESGDHCSICDAFRTGPKDPNQCEHIREHLGELWDNGQKVAMVNKDFKFFDISFVGRPADRIAWNLKVAAGEFIDSVKLAEAAELWVPDDLAIESAIGLSKLGHMRKIADFQAAYAGWLAGAPLRTLQDRYYFELRKAAASLDDATISELRRCDPDAVFSGLAKAGVVLDARSFFKYACGTDYGELKPYIEKTVACVRSIIPSRVKAGECQSVCNEVTFDVNDTSFARVTAKEACVLHKCAELSTLVGPACDERVIARTLNSAIVKFAVDTQHDIESNGRITEVALAEKYAAYQLSAVDAVLRYHENTDKSSVYAIVAAQNMLA